MAITSSRTDIMKSYPTLYFPVHKYLNYKYVPLLSHNIMYTESILFKDSKNKRKIKLPHKLKMLLH